MHDELHIDCRTCPVRDRMCGDCMVTHLYALAPPAPRQPALDRGERAALDMFVSLGLVDVADLASVEVEVDERGLRSVG
ncbi:hypothetical protein FB459_1689 [Yimella lutea]|uniref:Uncharacterized protein n=1 Tax=Yimella lutea TaxID=587872 RepID=A0A542EFW4_9MICO|nr:hypothetical protein [Yimella lutea]TQJ14241.1 hypothetical protein FB459_1689 [Yimella lutea]